MEVRNRFSPRVRVATVGGDPSGGAKQSMKAECDINNIMARYIKTGVVNHVNEFGAQYGEVPSVSFHEAVNLVRQAQETFDALPAQLRKRFSNDPGEFLAFFEDEKNREEGVRLGLVKPAEPASGGPGAEPPAAAIAAPGAAPGSTVVP